jgi:hypothetical protein
MKEEGKEACLGKDDLKKEGSVESGKETSKKAKKPVASASSKKAICGKVLGKKRGRKPKHLI